MDDMTNPAVTFCLALQFLTISPSILRRPFTARELGLSTGLFPLVGALIGGILYGSSWMLDLVFPEFVRVALLLALWVIFNRRAASGWLPRRLRWFAGWVFSGIPHGDHAG